MCGIAGTARFGGAPLDQRSDDVLAALSRAVAHRGPDGEQLFRDGPVGLVFRRLALVDPLGGDQPLTAGGGSVVLVANGEVYNHRELRAALGPDTPWRTRSDCEVLAHLYARDGLSFLDKVHGMFAIILWDRRRNRLVLARDRFGIKPLYVAGHADGVTVASEIKALFADPRCPRALDWDAALTDQCLNAAPEFTRKPVASWFRGVEVVPAGTILTIDLATGARRQHRYWQLPSFEGASSMSDADFVQRYRDLLSESVADCATADAEVGLFLSGGVDSAAVAALAARIGGLHTFTVLNGSTFANGDAEYAHLVASALQLPNHQLLFDADRVPDVEEWKRLLWLLETPMCGPEQYYKYELYRFAKVRRPELRGMLLGQASDEFNGGYSAQLSGGAGWEGFESSIAGFARQRRLSQRPDLAPWWRHHDVPLLTDGFLAGRTGGDDGRRYPEFVAWKYRDIQQYNCWHEDRTAAGNGVEARVPFLDHRIIELLATIPPARRARLLWDKGILRRAVRDLLPRGFTKRAKVPFYHGAGAEFTHRTFVRMLARDGAALVEEALSAPVAVDALDPRGVRDLLSRLQRQPEPGGVEFLLRLINLGLLEAMTRDLPAAHVDTPRRELPPALTIEDWSRDRADMQRLLRPAPRLQPEAVLDFAEDVLLVHPAGESETWYLAVDGQLEFVVDATEDSEWCAFLRAITGRRSLAEVFALSNTSHDSVGALLEEALDRHLLLTSPAAVPAAHRAHLGAFS
jgi:asparagine synthase (glutamine-hydrolysing)